MDSEQKASTATVITTNADDDKSQSKPLEVETKQNETEVKEIAQIDIEVGQKSTEQETLSVEIEAVKEPPEDPEIIKITQKETTDSSKSTIEDVKGKTFPFI